MKKILLFLLALSVVPAFSQYSFEMDLTKIRGVSIDYSGRAMLVLGTKTGENFFPMHVGYFDILGFGDLQSGDSRSEGVFGGIGFMLGVTGLDRSGDVSGTFYAENYRILNLQQAKKKVSLVGGRIRIITLLPFSSDVSILSSCFQVSIESGYMSLDYLAESRAFNMFERKVVTTSGLYLGIVPGFKIAFFSLDFGLGGLFNFYEKNINYKLPEKEDRKIANLKDPTMHFLLMGGLGLTFDICSFEN